MASFSLFKDINRKRVDWRLKVRCARKWIVPANDKFDTSLEFIFLDKTGDRIQATAKGNLIQKFDPIIQERHLYCIKFLSIVDNKGFYPATSHSFRLYFFEKTYVGPTTDRVFPQTVYNFRLFQEIKTSIHTEDTPLFDVIGRVICEDNEKPRICKTKNGASRLEFYLEDLQETRIPCTLWENYAITMQSYLEAAGKQPLIVLMQLCRSNCFKGNIGVSNTFHATKLLVDASIKEIEEFKSSMPKDEQETSYQVSQISTFSSQTIEDELHNQVYCVVTLETIPTINKDEYVWTIGTISGIKEDSGWCFSSCKECFKKVTMQAEGYRCDNCHAINSEQIRFRLLINVCDGTHFLNFLLWDKECQQLVGKSAKEISDKLEEVSIQGKTSLKGKGINFPDDFSKLLGREVLFKVHIQEKNFNNRDNVYVVSRVSQDENLISKYRITDHGTDLTDFDETDVSVVQRERDLVSENEVNSPAKTPFKRPSTGDEDCSDSIGEGRGSCSVAHSSNKFQKFIKIEKD